MNRLKSMTKFIAYMRNTTYLWMMMNGMVMTWVLMNWYWHVLNNWYLFDNYFLNWVWLKWMKCKLVLINMTYVKLIGIFFLNINLWSFNVDFVKKKKTFQYLIHYVIKSSIRKYWQISDEEHHWDKKWNKL